MKHMINEKEAVVVNEVVVLVKKARSENKSLEYIHGLILGSYAMLELPLSENTKQMIVYLAGC